MLYEPCLEKGEKLKTFIVDESCSDQRLDRYLSKLLTNAPINLIQKYIRQKKIKVNSKREKANYRLVIGDEIKIFLKDELFRNDRKQGLRNRSKKNLDIIFEDDDILVINKEKGQLVHPSGGNYKDALSTIVQSYLYENITKTFTPSSIQRLDFNTSGLVIFAKNYQSQKEYNELVRERKIDKYYICIVEGDFRDELDLFGYIQKDDRRNLARFTREKTLNSKEARTIFTKLDSNGSYSLIEAKLITGRFHQIRATLSSISKTIIGDVKYGSKNKKYGNTQALLAYKLAVKGKVFEIKNSEIHDIWARIKEEKWRVTKKFLKNCFLDTHMVELTNMHQILDMKKKI